jgi:hypothetical protein
MNRQNENMNLLKPIGYDKSLNSVIFNNIVRKRNQIKRYFVNKKVKNYGNKFISNNNTNGEDSIVIFFKKGR